MGILTNLVTAYEGYKDFQQRQQKNNLEDLGKRVGMWQSANPGATELPPELAGQFNKLVGIGGQQGQDQQQQAPLSPSPLSGLSQQVQAQGGGQPGQPQRQGGWLERLVGGNQQAQQQAPVKAPSRPIYALDPTGKLSNLGNVPVGADVEKLAQPKTVEYINPETDQRVDLPYGSVPPPGFRSADIYKQDRMDTRQDTREEKIAERQNKSLEAITERNAQKPDTAEQDKQRRIGIEQKKEMGQPVSISDAAWAKSYDRVASKSTGEPIAFENLAPQQQKEAKNRADAIVRGDSKWPNAYLLARDKTGVWNAALEMAMEQDPTLSEMTYPTRQATRKSFATGPDAKNVTSINTLVGHLSSLDKSAKGLDNSKVQLWNRMANAGVTAVGDPRITKFNMDLGAVESELASVFKQTGATDQEIKAWRDRISASQSPEQLQTAIREAVDLMGSRLQALKSKYEAGMGTSRDLQILTPKSRQTLESLVGKDAVEALEPKQEAEAKPAKPEGGKKEGRGQQQYPDGTKAKTKTGEPVTMKNGKWVPDNAN